MGRNVDYLFTIVKTATQFAKTIHNMADIKLEQHSGSCNSAAQVWIKTETTEDILDNANIVETPPAHSEDNIKTVS